MGKRRNTITTMFELTEAERDWLAQNGNMRHYLSELIRKDRERKRKAAAKAERGE